MKNIKMSYGTNIGGHVSSFSAVAIMAQVKPSVSILLRYGDGGKASYGYKGLKASLLGGNVEFADSINFWREEEYTIFGGNIEYEFNEHFSA
ncbi:MAG: hypothetical protein PVH88_03900 [Ignavibacteria bacterium]|jgi:hypothetical protein